MDATKFYRVFGHSLSLFFLSQIILPSQKTVRFVSLLFSILSFVSFETKPCKMFHAGFQLMTFLAQCLRTGIIGIRHHSYHTDSKFLQHQLSIIHTEWIKRQDMTGYPKVTMLLLERWDHVGQDLVPRAMLLRNLPLRVT